MKSDERNAERISSPRNARIKYVQKLARRRFRQKEGLFVAEGPRMVGEALASGAELESVLIAPDLFDGDVWKGFLAVLPAAVAVTSVTATVFRQAAATESPQGILAVVRMRRWTWEECCLPPSAVPGAPVLAILVDGLQDPGNLGTIIRAGEALGASGVILGQGTVDRHNPKAVRATMGAVFRFPVAEEVDLAAVIPELRARGCQVVATDPRADRRVDAVDWRRPSALILGSEGAGVNPGLAALADLSVSVPMPGRAESLNAGMATGIMLYEALRQRLS